MFDDLITHREPPQKRRSGCEDSVEHHLSEGAVMLAFAMHLLRTMPGLKEVTIHPDGEHGKRFDFKKWLENQGFSMCASKGKTSYGGTYSSLNQRQSIFIDPSSGSGDVVATVGNTTVVAECKGGVINTKHSGQQSRLRKGLCETVGQSLAVPLVKGTRQFIVVPRTRVTESWSERIAPRAFRAGIEIALVDGRGNVFDVKPTDCPPGGID